MWYLLYLFTNCPYFTVHGRINDHECTKTPVRAGTHNKFYYKTGSFKKTQNSFMHQFECEKTPSKSRIQNWVDHFEKYGTVENLNAASDNRPSHSGHPKKQTAELVESMRESIHESPKHSVCKRSQSLGMCRETFRRELVNNIRAYQYRIQTLANPYSLRQEARGALWQSRCSRRSRRHQVSLTSSGPQMIPTSILTGRRTPRQISSGGPPDPMN